MLKFIYYYERNISIYYYLLRTLRLLLIPSNWPAVFSPMLCEPHNSKPILAYVNVIDPIGKMYVNTMKITLYLKTRENLNSSVDEIYGRVQTKKKKGAKDKKERELCTKFNVHFSSVNLQKRDLKKFLTNFIFLVGKHICQKVLSISNSIELIKK